MRITALAPRLVPRSFSGVGSFSEVGPKLKHFAAIFLLFIIYNLSSIISPAFAQSPNSLNNSTDKITQSNPYMDPNNNPDVPKNLHSYTQNVMVEVMSAMVCQLSGVDAINPNQKCLGIDSKTGQIGFVEGGGGVIGLMGNMIAMLYTPPIHTGDYFNYLSQNFGIAKKTYAQGVGFNSIKPLVNIWSAFRNIVYLVMVIVFVLIGLAIMLRVKLDPRTVMSIENQIPKIIIMILLVTFSFAIAGFLIDLMYVFIYLIYGVISSAPGIAVNKLKDLNPAALQGKTPLEAVGGLGGVNGLANHLALSVKDIMGNLLGVTGMSSGIRITEHPPYITFEAPQLAGTATPMDWIYNIIGFVAAFGAAAKGGQITSSVPIVGSMLGAALGAPIGFLAAQTLLREVLPWLIAYLIVFLALLFALFRLWFQLLKAYVFILVNIVLGPFWILTGIIPGGAGVGGWLRMLLAYLSSFPAAIAMFLLGKVFMDNFATGPTGQFAPPLIGNPADPNMLGSLIGLGVILLTPSVVDKMYAAFQAPKIDLSAIWQSLGAGASTPGRIIGGGMSTVFTPHYKKDAVTGATTLVYPGGGFGRLLRGFGLVR